MGSRTQRARTNSFALLMPGIAFATLHTFRMFDFVQSDRSLRASVAAVRACARFFSRACSYPGRHFSRLDIRTGPGIMLSHRAAG